MARSNSDYATATAAAQSALASARKIRSVDQEDQVAWRIERVGRRHGY
jgi:hypothetical protein